MYKKEAKCRKCVYLGILFEDDKRMCLYLFSVCLINNSKFYVSASSMLLHMTVIDIGFKLARTSEHTPLNFKVDSTI